MSIKQLLMFVLLSIWGVQSANAAKDAEISVLKLDQVYEIVSGALPEIYIDGPISDATIGKFVATVAVHQIDSGIVYFNSLGGHLVAGIDLGRTIRKMGLSTRIGVKGAGYGEPKVGVCYSACVLAYIGGRYRFSKSSSRLGVHRFSSDAPSKADLDVAQIVSAAITTYLSEMGVDVALFNRMSQTGRDEIYHLSPQESQALGIVNNGMRPSTWTLQNSEEVIYLKGEQENWRGTGKFLLTCQKGALIAAAFYEAGSKASVIEGSTKRYSLRVNDAFLPIAALAAPVQVANEYVVAYFQPTPDQLKKLLSANNIGFAFHPPNPDLFYGFQIDSRDSHQKVADYIKYCNAQHR